MSTAAKFLLAPINEMALSVRTYNRLKLAGIGMGWDLAESSPTKLMKLRGFGRRSLNEVKALMTANGVHLDFPQESITTLIGNKRKRRWTLRYRRIAAAASGRFEALRESPKICSRCGQSLPGQTGVWRLECSECGIAMIAGSPFRQYCGDRCRNTAKRRRRKERE